jgi:two-component system sensor histidine kinase DesK
MRSGAKLRLAHEEIEQLAKVAERERIARDLHDVLGHTLSVIVLKAELAGRLFSRDPQRAAAEISDVEQISRKALGEVREAIRGYRSEGLMAEIDRAQHVLDAAGVTLRCDSKPPSLNPAQESVLALAVREAVTNIVRHAQASHCHLEFRNVDGCTFLSMEDDGRGGVREEGNGLRGMRERVESLGGKFNVQSNVESTRGTRLTIEIPERA